MPPFARCIQSGRAALRAYPLLMESKAGSKFLFCRASYRKTAAHFSGRTLTAAASTSPTASIFSAAACAASTARPRGCVQSGVRSAGQDDDASERHRQHKLLFERRSRRPRVALLLRRTLHIRPDTAHIRFSDCTRRSPDRWRDARQAPRRWRACSPPRRGFPPRRPAPACWTRRAPAPTFRPPA